MLRPLFILLAMSVVANADIIPNDREIDWMSGYHVTIGVPGGIPTVTTVRSNMVTAGADATGSTDAYNILNGAYGAAQSNEVIYFPAGRFKIGTAIGLHKDGVVYRGAGIGVTFIDFINDAYFNVGNGDWIGYSPTNTIAISAGATAGSTSIVVVSTVDIAPGKLIILTQTNGPLTRYNTGTYGTGPVDDGHGLDRLQASTHRVLTTNATTITFTPPLAFALTNAPMITTLPQYLSRRVGFESMTINMTNSTSNKAIGGTQISECWIKDVEIAGASSRQIWWSQAIQSEIRGCYTRDTSGTGPNHEGIDLYQNACWNVVEDNICDTAGFPAIILGDFGGGCVGNIVAFNFITNTISGSSVAGYAISDNHGPHNTFNLFEGNVAQNIYSDGYYGGASQETFFRNALDGRFDRSTYDDEAAIGLMHWSYQYNVIGNVLGTESYSTIYFATGAAYQDGVIYRMGYPNVGNRSFTGSSDNPAADDGFDTGVTNSIILHGNYDYASSSVIWDAGIADHTLPNSYYLSEAPSWWGTNRWPAIDPESSVKAAKIPAQNRYLGISNFGGDLPAAPGVQRIGGISLRAMLSPMFVVLLWRLWRRRR